MAKRCIHTFSRAFDATFATDDTILESKDSSLPRDLKSLLNREMRSLGLKRHLISRFLANRSGFVLTGNERTLESLGIHTHASANYSHALASEFVTRMFIKTGKLVADTLTATDISSLPIFTDAAKVFRKHIFLVDICINNAICCAPMQIISPINPSDVSVETKVKLLNDIVQGRSLRDPETGLRPDDNVRIPAQARVVFITINQTR